jgi:phosphate transport system protein
MGSLVEDMFQKAVRSILDRDGNLAQEVIDSDENIDQLEVKIEDLAVHITVLRQPAASDLRRVVTALHINRELERMGDKAVDIAQRCIKLLRYPVIEYHVKLTEAAEIVRSMIRDTLEAYLDRNTELARQVIARDDEVDEIRDQVFRELSVCMVRDPESIHPCMEIILTFRHLERIGDLAADICEDTIYMVDGEIVKHQFDR